MKKIHAAELQKMWEATELTPEQAIDYLIKNQVDHETRLIAINLSWVETRADVNRLLIHNELDRPEWQRKPKPPLAAE